MTGTNTSDPPVRVMLVDDSAVIRRLLGKILDAEASIDIVGTAINGRAAVDRAPRMRPEVIILDIEMPEMDGLAALPKLKAAMPGCAVIMFSTLTERAATSTLEALARGADDYVTKPSNTGSFEKTTLQIREVLVPKILTLAGHARRMAGSRRSQPRSTAPPAPPSGRITRRAPELVAIGVSTGGPNALAELLPQLDRSFPAPVLVTQHMPPIFTRLLAERLDARCSLTVREAVPGVTAEPGQIWIAPGGQHLVVRRRADGRIVLDLDDGPPVQSCRPSVDVMFASVAKALEDGVVGVVLTGMGADGRDGSRAIRGVGGRVIAQDEASSVVWSMPGATVRAGLATDVLPLDRIAARLGELATGRRNPALTRTSS